MAVGGRKFQSSTFEHGCDFLYDYTCSPCVADGNNKEAVKYCIECGEYLCGSCLSNHNRFAKMKTHQVVDPAKYDSRRMPQKSSDVPLITIGCNKHHGKVLDMFCGEHNQVCCAACLALKHSTCKNRFYIPDIASGLQDKEEYKQHESENKKFLTRLETTKQNRNKELALQKKKKDAIYASFKQLRAVVTKRFDELEKETVQLVENRFRHSEAVILEDVETSMKLHEVLQGNDDKLTLEKKDPQKFVLLKTAEEDLNNAKNVLQKIHSIKEMSLDFKISEEISKCFTGVSALGCFNESIPSKLFSVQDKEEKYRCRITGLCQLEDGCLIIIDLDNQSIKRLGSTFTILDRYKLSSKPWSVCTFGNEEVAVSLFYEKAIQFVRVKGKMQVSRSFKVKDECTGLASSADSLYVGFFNRKHIQVYDESGYPLKIIELACENIRYVPWSIVVTPNKKRVYVATHENGIISVDTVEQKCRKLDIPALKFATSVILSDNGSLLISCKEGNKIIRYNDGKSDILLSKADGIDCPSALCVYQREELIVASDKSDAIRVYSHIDKPLS